MADRLPMRHWKITRVSRGMVSAWEARCSSCTWRAPGIRPASHSCGSRTSTSTASPLRSSASASCTLISISGSLNALTPLRVADGRVRGRTLDLGALTLAMREQGRPSRVDQRVVRLAAAQGDVISVQQLRDLGADKSWIDRRKHMGWLVQVFHGVYAVG